MKTTTTGFAVRANDGEGYYDMNGIGDWSLAGDAETCSIFGTPDEAFEAMADADCDDDYEVIHISRNVEVTVGPAIARSPR
jgi:hypothetical protein